MPKGFQIPLCVVLCPSGHRLSSRTLVFGLLTASLFAGCEQGPSARELATRVERSHPAWESYQEDIKGQIGAGPVAEWAGAPSRLWLDKDGVFVSFSVTGPWADRVPGVPILLRDPSGRVQGSLKSERDGTMIRYTFERPKLDAMPAWLEIKYPHTERRIVLSERGDWQASTSAN